jgi:hypothetical protein
MQNPQNWYAFCAPIQQIRPQHAQSRYDNKLAACLYLAECACVLINNALSFCLHVFAPSTAYLSRPLIEDRWSR